MARKITLAIVALLICSAPVLAAEGDGKHSGRVVEIRPDGKLVIEEMGPWLGPGTVLFKRTVELTPDTNIRVVRPTGKWQDDASPGYEVQSADFRALKPGDFITAITAGGQKSVAIEVMQPEGGESGLASPRSGDK